MTSTCFEVGSIPVALTLLSHAHQAAVLSHPTWIDIARESDPAHQLVWMVDQGLLSYDELDELQTFEEEPSERDRIVEDAYAILGERNTAANCDLLDQLLADRIITPAHHAKVLALPLNEPCDSPSSLLFSIVLVKIMPVDAFYALHAEVLAEPRTGRSRRRETVRETYGFMQEYEALTGTGRSALGVAKRQANYQLAFTLAGAAAIIGYIVARWPG